MPLNGLITVPSLPSFLLRREGKTGTTRQIEAINSTAYNSHHALAEWRADGLPGLGLSVYGVGAGR